MPDRGQQDGILLKRSDGHGIEVTEAELRAGAAAALLPALARHPGLEPAAADQLTRVAKEGPVIPV